MCNNNFVRLSKAGCFRIHPVWLRIVGNRSLQRIRRLHPSNSFNRRLHTKAPSRQDSLRWRSSWQMQLWDTAIGSDSQAASQSDRLLPTWGVVTSTAPSKRCFLRFSTTDRCSSDVPGGVSTSSTSSSPHATSDTNWPIRAERGKHNRKVKVCKLIYTHK